MLSFKLVLTFFLIVQFEISLARKKNACKHLDDYPVMHFASSSDCFYNPNVNSNMYKMVANNGYDLRPYNITTPQGYVLTLFRISPKGRNGNERQPIYIQHGILTDSSIMVMTDKRSLAFSLVEEGYDVWLGNIRTSIYTKTNVHFSSKSKRYWDFGLDELASDDLSTGLKKVANVTRKAGEIIYIGHSLGSTMILMYASQFAQEARSLIKGIVMLSPIAYFTPNFFVKFLLEIGPTLIKLHKSLNINVLLYDIKRIRLISQLFIMYFPHWLFEFPLGLLSGKPQLFMPEDLMVFLSYYPDTINIGTLNQYIQMYHANQFQKYDYGSSKNQQLYSQTKPPVYDLSKITMPVYMFYGANDAYIKTEGVQRIYRELGSTEKDMQIIPIGRNESDLQFAHNDLILSKYIHTLFYPDLYRYLMKLQ